MAQSFESFGESRRHVIGGRRKLSYPRSVDQIRQLQSSTHGEVSLRTGNPPSEHKSFEVFTTESKIHIKRGCWQSIQNIQAFMLHLFQIKLFKCGWATLEYEFINFFCSNDSRTVTRYIGRPRETIRSSGSSMVRINRASGRVAPFEYMNTRRISRKMGLMERLGYITLKPEELNVEQGAIKLSRKTENWIVIIHHERMSYFTKQVPLEVANPLQEMKESNNSSNVTVFVSTLSANPSLIDEAEGVREPALEDNSGEARARNYLKRFATDVIEREEQKTDIIIRG